MTAEQAVEAWLEWIADLSEADDPGEKLGRTPSAMANNLIDRLSAQGFAIVPRVATDEMLMAPELDMLATGAEARMIWDIMIEGATR